MVERDDMRRTATSTDNDRLARPAADPKRGDAAASPTNRTATAGAAPERDDRSIGSLIKELTSESSRLIREEVQLAKAEMREKVKVYEKNAVKMAIGGVLLLGALIVLLIAVNRALTALLDTFMEIELAMWIAPLILAGVFAMIGWSMFKSGQKAMSEEGVTPHRTVNTIREEKEWVQREARDIRNG